MASADEVLKLVKSSGGRTYGFDPCTAGNGNCIGTVYFENVWLHRLRLAPRTAFGFRLTVENGRLASRWLTMVSMRAAPGGYSDWGTFVNEGRSTLMFPDEVLRTASDRFFRIVGAPSSDLLGVMITPEAPPNLRELAYPFNFNCLSKVGGCKTYEEMLPILQRKDLMTQNPWFHEFKPD